VTVTGFSQYVRLCLEPSASSIRNPKANTADRAVISTPVESIGWGTANSNPDCSRVSLAQSCRKNGTAFAIPHMKNLALTINGANGNLPDFSQSHAYAG
jgi:hypothetical protein